MILSVSRRTDIPNYFAEWFINRIHEGFLYVKNPMNDHQISKINLSPEFVDCIVFWTKNPKNMMKYLDQLKNYMYYFQFTITSYGRDIERNIPDKKKIIIPCFKELSKEIGSKRVIWRYDPIMFTDRYTEEYHLRAFDYMAEQLAGYTQKCVISFVDEYRKNMSYISNEASKKSNEELLSFAEKLVDIAGKYEIKIGTCSEEMDFSNIGIEHNSCIDKKLIEELIGCRLNVKKDKNQRSECKCVESIDVGKYNTCKNGCTYCYATYSKNSVSDNLKLYNSESPLLCGMINELDRITERKVKNYRDGQMTLEDIMPGIVDQV